MQAILLAAGKSSRLFPFAGKTTKAALSLMGKPLIVRTIEALQKVGIEKCIVVVSPGSGVEELVRAHIPKGIQVHFIVHDGARGMGEALLDAKELIENDFFLLHAHHFECDAFFPKLLKAQKNANANAALLVRFEETVDNFGVATLDGDRVLAITEKPQGAKGGYRVVGMYLLPKSFIQILQKIEKQHYSFELALHELADKAHVVALKTTDPVITLKYPWHILDVSDYLLRSLKGSVAKRVNVSKTAVIEGEVIISDGVTIEDGVVIKGPCFLAKNVYVGTNAILRNGVIAEEGVKIGANMEVKHSVLMANSTTHSGYIGDSVIGANNKIAALFCTGNVRIDRDDVKVVVKGEKIASGKKSLGVFMGDDTKLGIRVSTMPGVLIGARVIVGPSTTVYKNIPDQTTYYTKIQEVVEQQSSKAIRESPAGEEKIVLFDIDYTLFDTHAFKESKLTTFALYDEVVDVLGMLAAIAHLGIFSEGENELQQAKLLKTAIESHFSQEHVHIVAKKDESIEHVLDTYKNNTLFLVDDKLTVLHRASEISPTIYTIWVKRGPFASVQQPIEGFSPDAVIEDLRMVLPIVAGV